MERSGKKEPAQTGDLQQQYDLLAETQGYLGLVVAAVLLSYHTVDQQRTQIETILKTGEGSTDDLNMFSAQFASAAMVLRATLYFYALSRQALGNAPDDPIARVSGDLNFTMNALILIVAVIRIYVLLFVQFSSGASEAAELMEEEDPLI